MGNNLKINNDLLDVYVKKSDYTELETEHQRLKEENEKLKKEIKQIGTSFIKKGDYARALEQKNERLSQMVNGNLKIENDKLKQTLHEIREIADRIANANCTYVIEAGNIIKKINEVIGAE